MNKNERNAQDEANRRLRELGFDPADGGLAHRMRNALAEDRRQLENWLRDARRLRRITLQAYLHSPGDSELRSQYRYQHELADIMVARLLAKSGGGGLVAMADGPLKNAIINGYRHR
jgi:hypothetical protein